MGRPVSNSIPLVSLDDIRAAAVTIGNVITQTPLVRVTPNTIPDIHDTIWLKLESLQVTGSFKLRGAFNAVAGLSDAQRTAGVVTTSSGNHAQAIAWACRAYETSSVVVMPEYAEPAKIEATRALGAEVILAPGDEARRLTEEIARTQGRTFIPAFAHPDVLAGQGTVGLEIMRDFPDVSLLLVPVGGGGLISGIATAVKELSPSVKVVGVEPELAADAAESFRSGTLTSWTTAQTSQTVADGLRSASLSELAFAHIRTYVDDIVTVSEAEILSTVGLLARRAHLIAEPSGATALAAYVHKRASLPPGRAVAVVSGGNVNMELLKSVL